MKKLKPNKLALRIETVAHLHAIESNELVHVRGGGMASPVSDTRGVCTTRTPVSADGCG